MSYAAAVTIVVLAVIAGLAAVAVGAWSFREALRDRAWIRREGIGNGRRIAAYRAVRAEASRLTSISLIAGGLVLLLIGQARLETRPETVSWATGITLAAILVALVLLAIDAVYAVRDRRHLDAELAAAHRTRPSAAAEARDGLPRWGQQGDGLDRHRWTHPDR